MKTVGFLAAAALAAAGAFLASAAAAEPSVSPVRAGTAHQALFSIAFDGARGYAAGAAGAVLVTTDGGKTWSSEATPAAGALLDVAAKAGRTIAVGQEGIVLVRTPDGSWKKVDSGSTARLLAVSVNGAGKAVAVGSFGTVLASNDGGQSWHSIAPTWNSVTELAEEPHVYDVQIDDAGIVTIVGEFGLILRSSANGDWKLLRGGEESLFSFELRPDGVGYAVGQSGVALKTTDGGTSWSALNTKSKAILLGVGSSKDGRVLITGNREVLESTDGGSSFRRLSEEEMTNYWTQDVASDSNGHFLTVGQAGRVTRIRN